MKLEKFKELTETAQAVATVIAILVGGWWTYTSFIQGREKFPHLNIKQRVSHIALTDRWRK